MDKLCPTQPQSLSLEHRMGVQEPVSLVGTQMLAERNAVTIKLTHQANLGGLFIVYH